MALLRDSRFFTVVPLILLCSFATNPALAARRAPPPAAPVGPAGLAEAAHAAQGRGETELALRLAQSAIVADPARPESYDALADIYAATNQPDFARNYYNAALIIDPADPAALKAIVALDHAPPERAAKAGREDSHTGNQ